MRKVIGILVVLLVVFTGYSTLAKLNERQTENIISNIDSLNGGWYEEIDGVKILHVSGTYYDMGYQHGYLLKDMVVENHRALSEIYTQFMPYEEIINLYYGLKDYIPQDFKDEMQGLADGSGLLFDDVAFSVAKYLIAHDMTACVTGAVWDTATLDGKMYHFRSGDWFRCSHNNRKADIRWPWI